MKKTLLVLVYFFVAILTVKSQTLYGTTFNGGADGGGTIDKYSANTNSTDIPKSLETGFAANPQFTALIQATNGNLYGMTYKGGAMNSGVIFSYDPVSSTYKKLKDFDILNGGNPYGSLTLATDGKLYGMTSNGGNKNFGVLFSFDPSSSSYTKLLDFDSTNGANPSGNLVQASNGNLYGMTTYGGNNNEGVVFSFDPTSSVFNKLNDFDSLNGADPFGSMTQASDGNLYGMTTYGGTKNSGTLFSFDPTSSLFKKLTDFDFANGSNPYGGLIQASDGKLYGLTAFGGDNDCGVVFSFDPELSSFRKLNDLDFADGANPCGSLIQGSDGKLYGMTANGGNIFMHGDFYSYGVVFSFDPTSDSYVKLKDFDFGNGGNPSGSLLQAADGRLYGLTSKGGEGWSGDGLNGVIFSFDPNNTAYTVLGHLGGDELGSNFAAGLIHAKNGKLYGMTTNGGSNGVGLIYSYDPQTSTYTNLKNLDYANGSHPFGGLMQASDGRLYGMTAYGGTSNSYNFVDWNELGVIFSYDPDSSKYTKVADFTSEVGYHGGRPYGSLVEAGDGKLYGMTSVGGPGYRGNGEGVLFSVDPKASGYTIVKTFATYDPTGVYVVDDLNGGDPYGTLVLAKNGRLYGMTSEGGAFNQGVIFSYDPGAAIYSKLVDFDSTEGSNPYGSLVQAKDGKLYGMTYDGGSNNAGVIFSFDPSSLVYSKLFDLDFDNGSNPYGDLMQASDGKFYGMTSSGGSNDLGVIFSYDPSAGTYTKLVDYDGSNGAQPYFGSAFIELPESIVLSVPDVNNVEELKILPNPNNGSFVVRMKLDSPKEVSFKLYTLTGQIIYQSPQYNYSGMQTTSINVNGLAAGVYLLQTKIGNRSSIQRIVIAR